MLSFIAYDAGIGSFCFQSFLTRKYYFNNPEDGFFKKTKRKVVPPSPMTGMLQCGEQRQEEKDVIFCQGSKENHLGKEFGECEGGGGK